MTEKNVLISIRGRQSTDGEPQVVELTTDGVLRDNGDSLSLCYQESAVTGMEGVHTEFEIVAPDKVLLKRTGNVNSTMVFEHGKKHDSLYDVGCGALLVSVDARSVESHLTAEGGEFSLYYLIEVEDEPVSANVYIISVKDVT